MVFLRGATSMINKQISIKHAKHLESLLFEGESHHPLVYRDDFDLRKLL